MKFLHAAAHLLLLVGLIDQLVGSIADTGELGFSSCGCHKECCHPSEGESDCTVQVTNVALGGRASQSSAYKEPDVGYLAAAINSIDGNPDTNYYHGSCTHTHNEMSPWWRVDLLKPHIISHIIIINRGDCCGQRLIGVEILVGDSLSNNGNNNARCGIVTAAALGEKLTFSCNRMVGRYVNIVLPGKTEFLHFCEVEVYGVPVCPKKLH